jgi:hypothetical protein
VGRCPPVARTGTGVALGGGSRRDRLCGVIGIVLVLAFKGLLQVLRSL